MQTTATPLGVITKIRTSITEFFTVHESVESVYSRAFWQNEWLHLRKTYLTGIPSSLIITWLFCYSPLIDRTNDQTSIFYIFTDRPLFFFLMLLTFSYSTDFAWRVSFWFTRWVMEKYRSKSIYLGMAYMFVFMMLTTFGTIHILKQIECTVK